MARVIAHHDWDQMFAQPLSVNIFQDKDTNTIRLGGAGAPGAAVVMNGQSVMIDFGAGTPPAGFYISSYMDPNDPTKSKFELRWAVFSQVSYGTVVSKRIIIGCRRTQSFGDGQLLLPVTLDTVVQK
jgi:hypothetical protein